MMKEYTNDLQQRCYGNSTGRGQSLQQMVQKQWRISTKNERPLLHATLTQDRIDTDVGHRSSLRVKTINL